MNFRDRTIVLKRLNQCPSSNVYTKQKTHFVKFHSRLYFHWKLPLGSVVTVSRRIRVVSLKTLYHMEVVSTCGSLSELYNSSIVLSNMTMHMSTKKICMGFKIFLQSDQAPKLT